MLPTLKNHSNPIWDICPCNIKSLTYARLKFVHFEVHVYILTRLWLFCYCLHIILIKCLSKCMFEWSLKNNICKLVDTCAICWNVNNMNFGVMILHPLSTFGRKKLKSENFKYFIHGMEFICYGFRKIIRYSFTICGSPKHQVRI